MVSRGFFQCCAIAFTLALCNARLTCATRDQEGHSGWDMDLSDGSSPTGSARWNTFVDTVTDEQNLNEPEFAAQQAFDDMHWNRATTGTVERAAKRPRHDRARSSSNTIASPDLRLPQLHGLPLNIIGSKLGARDHAMLAAANRDLADFTRSHPRRRMIEHMRANLHNPAVLAEIVRDGTEVDVSDVVEMLEERAWREGTHGYWNLDPLLLAVRFPLDDVLPLVRAIRRGSTELAYQLIAAGAPFHRNTLPTAEEGLFETPCEAARVLTSEKMYNRMSRVGCLLISVASDQVDMADYLLRANPEIVKARDAHGRTALHLARSASMVQMLVEKYSADVNVNDSVDESPLTKAIIHNNVDTVRYLLARAAVADPQYASRVPLIMSIAMRADLEITELLLTEGNANVDRIMQTNGGQTNTALIQAINMQLEDATALLLRHGANTDIRQGAYAPLHIACFTQFTKGVELLLDAGADPLVASVINLTPLHLAALVNSVEITRILLPYYGRDSVNMPDVHGQTALHYASVAGAINVVRALVEAGADVHAVEELGWTPLWLAVAGPPVADDGLLADHVVDGVVQDLEDADQRKNRWSVVQFLVQNGARADLINNDGETMAQKARVMGRMGIAKFLESVTTASP